MEELFEARNPKYLAEIAPFDGTVIRVESEGNIVHVELEASRREQREYYLGEETMKSIVAK